MRSESAYIHHGLGEGDGLHEGDGCVVGGTHIVEDWTECVHTHRQTDRQK